MVESHKKAKAAARFSVVAFYIFMAFASGACGRKSVPLPVNATEGYCPVCSMKVKAENQWTSEIVYKDDTKLMFESPGDMLKFYSSPGSYDVADAQKELASIDRILLKEYQTRGPIDARVAALVYKSNVSGPMGPDVIAFFKPEDAREFASTNGGRVIVFDDLTHEMIQNLRKR
ncbi:MAG TPA: nitrous oxide reductase accessory protein NosL [Blastocatellia bacterium]|jgi:nitrous oxide reductase accessory protein NosL|nr:nitrous oxide reductase accessory protein NosL [Blastocatellia bacterium]